MNVIKNKYERIKNLPVFKLPRDFGYNAFSYLVLGIFMGVGIAVQYYTQGPIETETLVAVVIGTIIMGGFLTIFPLWITVIQFLILSWVGMYAKAGGSFYPLYSFIAAGLVFSPAFQLVQHWDKVVILRFGKFRKARGPGLFMLFPIIDRVTAFVDTRIRATDFSAEKTLTMDTVPVHVDALCFWMVWDAKKSVLEVENFIEAVVLSAQTALRDGIGKHELADLLSEREHIGKEIQQILDAKTNPWGISILSVEITDIIIPRELEDAMSKRAQAERERQSRVILGSAEVEVAEKFEQAAKRYKDNPTALHLRAMNMIYEGIKKHGSIMLLPSTALESMSLGTVMGALALGKEKGIVPKGKAAGAADSEEDGNVGEDNGE
ncbi:MAG: slipin family protein [Spirochaetales bacterium]|nr:slipin family protein [Spirochaetales bacterium]